MELKITYATETRARANGGSRRKAARKAKPVVTYYEQTELGAYREKRKDLLMEQEKLYVSGEEKV